MSHIDLYLWNKIYSQMKKNYCYLFFRHTFFRKWIWKPVHLQENLHSKYEKIIWISKYKYLLKNNIKNFLVRGGRGGVDVEHRVGLVHAIPVASHLEAEEGKAHVITTVNAKGLRRNQYLRLGLVTNSVDFAIYKD